MLINFKNFIGQEKSKQNLLVYINASKIRKTKLDHIFIYAKSGMGKSTLANLIASEMKQKIHIYYANNFRKPSDLLSCFSKIKDFEILFIDEIHRLNKELEEYMFPILENNNIAITLGKNYNAKIVNIKLNNFTVICATTELHKINEQFINRFPIFIPFENYSIKEIQQIAENLFIKNNIKITTEALELFVKNTKYNPRIVNNFINRINDYILVDNIKQINYKILEIIFKKLNIFENGLCEIDIQYLKILKNGPFSIKTIKQLSNLPLDMILNKIEPNLLQNNYIIKTNRGRILTKKGNEILNKI